MYLNRSVTYVYTSYRCLFFGSFLWASKEMNILISSFPPQNINFH